MPLRERHTRGSSKRGSGARAVKHFERVENDGKPLRDDQATLYRALAARINYLSLDTADVAFAGKELCRDFAAPTIHSVEALRRVGRYLHHHPRLVYEYCYEAEKSVLVCFVDTDFAGCLTTAGPPPVAS